VELSDGYKIAGRRRPGSQDVSICKKCAEIIVLTESDCGLVLRATTASEYLALPLESQALLRVAFELVHRQQRSAGAFRT
jgi:hypothetical protein